MQPKFQKGDLVTVDGAHAVIRSWPRSNTGQFAYTQIVGKAIVHSTAWCGEVDDTPPTGADTAGLKGGKTEPIQHAATVVLVQRAAQVASTVQAVPVVDPDEEI